MTADPPPSPRPGPPAPPELCAAQAPPVLSRRRLIAGWAAFLVFDYVTRLFVYQDLAQTLWICLATAPLILGQAAALAAIYRRLGFAGRLSPAALVWVLSLSIVAGGAAALAADIARPWLGVQMPGGLLLAPALSVSFYYFLVYLCWSLVCFWIAAEGARRAAARRAAQAEAEAREAELQRLRLQLDPHFLLNALNGAGEALRDDPAAAAAMLADLSVFLSRSLRGIDRLVVPLAEETEALTAYLDVQRSRFGARFDASLEVDAQALGRDIVSFLLQPLAENAVEHGRRVGRRSLSIVIAAPAPDCLEIEMRNPGRLADAAPAGTRSGIGLANVRRRLALHYPGRHRLALTQQGEAVVARLRLDGAPLAGPPG